MVIGDVRCRLARRVSGIYGRSGSPMRAARFLVRYGLGKTPLLARWAFAKARPRGTRRALTSRLTVELPKLLIHTAGGGVGDDIVVARFIRDLRAACGVFEFVVACNDEARSAWIYEAVPGFRGCLSASLFGKSVDMFSHALRVDQMVQVAGETTSKPCCGQFEEKFGNVRANIAASLARNKLLLKGVPYTWGDLARRAVFANATRATYLHAQAGIDYGGDQLRLRTEPDAIARFGLRGSDFVTLHNGFDPAFIVSGSSSTKCYGSFDRVVSRLIGMCPGIRFVQLGSPRTSRAIASAQVDLIGKTSLAEAAAIISASRLHIDVDSGLVHIAACLGVQSLVLFGPTDVDYFGYKSNINLRPRFCGGCWWTSEAWMDQCARSFDEARCMSSHAVEDVVAHVVEALERPPVGGRAPGPERKAMHARSGSKMGGGSLRP